MRLATGPRPFSIKLFALAFLTAALNTYISGLSQLPQMQAIYELRYPWIDWNRDWTIVALSAMFSIAFIPVVWIYCFASRMARWLVTLFIAIRLLDLPQQLTTWFSMRDVVSPLILFEPTLIVLALICLFMPGSNQWLAKKKETDLAVFE
ncbi:MAG: hypothetical protein AAGK01_12720 [Pseudomonadota bacterium]